MLSFRKFWTIFVLTGLVLHGIVAEEDDDKKGNDDGTEGEDGAEEEGVDNANYTCQLGTVFEIFDDSSCKGPLNVELTLKY